MNFSPTIEPAPPHGILVDLSGSQLPDLSLLQSQAITACQKNVLVSMASTRWVARCAVAYLQRESAGNSLLKPLVIANDREREFLAPLSVRYLTESEMEDAEKLIERLWIWASTPLMSWQTYLSGISPLNLVQTKVLFYTVWRQGSIPVRSAVYTLRDR